MSKSVLRLIDANFNRVQEGLRVIEDLLRFSGRDFSLIRDLKKNVVNIKKKAALSGKLLFGRESFLDEGKDNTHSIYKTERELLSANFQRVKEAFRSLEEGFRFIGNVEISGVLQRLRFSVYELEKSIVGQALPVFNRPALYLIFDVDMLVASGRDVNLVLTEVLEAGVDILQLRFSEKISPIRVLSLATKIQESNEAVSLVINNRVDIADILFSGLHIGQDDIPVDLVRQRFMVKFVGLSCHSFKQIQLAQDMPVDYFSIGPIFKTSTKPDYVPVDVELIEEVLPNICKPFVVIGGITIDKLPLLLEYKPWAVCVCSDILKSSDVKGKISEYMEVLNRYAYDSIN